MSKIKLTESQQRVALDLLKKFVELANFLGGPRPDVNHATVRDGDFLEAEEFLKLFGKEVEFDNEPLRTLLRRWGEYEINGKYVWDFTLPEPCAKWVKQSELAAFNAKEPQA